MIRDSIRGLNKINYVVRNYIKNSRSEMWILLTKNSLCFRVNVNDVNHELFLLQSKLQTEISITSKISSE